MTGENGNSVDVMAKVAKQIGPRPWVYVETPRKPSAIATKEALLQKLPADDRTRPRLVKEIDALKADLVRGCLLPLSEGGWWLAKARMQAVYLYLKRRVDRLAYGLPNDEDGTWAIGKAIDLQVEDIYNRAIVQQALVRCIPPLPGEEPIPVRDTQGEPIPAFADAEIKHVDPGAVAAIVSRYFETFELSAEDLGSDPMTPATVQ
jgi:hypothetical protein